MQAELVLNKTQIQYTVQIPKGSYFAVGYGTSMSAMDVVAFRADSTTPGVDDMFATDRSLPRTDKNDYISVITSNSTHVTFVSKRPLNTGDSVNDYSINLVGNTNGQNFIFHFFYDP